MTNSYLVGYGSESYGLLTPCGSRLLHCYVGRVDSHNAENAPDVANILPHQARCLSGIAYEVSGKSLSKMGGRLAVFAGRASANFLHVCFMDGSRSTQNKGGRSRLCACHLSTAWAFNSPAATRTAHPPSPHSSPKALSHVPHRAHTDEHPRR